jgi:hypothetical protein
MWRYWFRDKRLDTSAVHPFLNAIMWKESHCRQHRFYLWRHKRDRGNGTISDYELSLAVARQNCGANGGEHQQLTAFVAL